MCTQHKNPVHSTLAALGSPHEPLLHVTTKWTTSVVPSYWRECVDSDTKQVHTLRSSGGRPESAKPLRCPPIFRPTWKVAAGYPIGSWATSLALPRRFEAIPRFERRTISGSCVSVPGSGACVFVGQRNQSIRVALHGGMAAREEESGASRSCWTGPFGSPQRHWTSHGLTGPFRKRKKKKTQKVPPRTRPSLERWFHPSNVIAPSEGWFAQPGWCKRERPNGTGEGGEGWGGFLDPPAAVFHPQPSWPRIAQLHPASASSSSRWQVEAGDDTSECAAR